MKNKTTKRLENYDELFGLNDHDTVTGEASHTKIDLTKLVPFSEHPFKIYEGKKLDDMVESIKENGVITPIIVREKDDGLFEILSGHNRVNASKAVGLMKIPAIIKSGLSEAEARIIVTDTNFIQRSIAEMLPSELAKSLKMQLEACKEAKQKQSFVRAIQNDENSNNSNDLEQGAPVGHPRKSRDIIANNSNISRENARRYIRLNSLTETLLTRVDKGVISLRSAVDLSYLNREEQLILSEVLNNSKYKVDMVKAKKLRELSNNSQLDKETVSAVLSDIHGKKASPGASPIRLKQSIISKFFTPDYKKEDINKVIEEALTLYFKTSGHKKL